MRAVAYVRVSTDEQNPELQRQAVRRHAGGRGWTLGRVYEDRRSGATAVRPALRQLLQDAQRGTFDVVIVWRFDRFARSTADLLSSLQLFRSLGIDFISVTEAIDTTTPLGEFFFTLLGAFAQLERTVIRERVLAGVRAKRARQGGRWGRPTVLTPRQLERARRLRSDGKSVRQVCAELNLPRTTVRRALAPARRSA